jgi:hypothetical protein
MYTSTITILRATFLKITILYLEKGGHQNLDYQPLFAKFQCSKPWEWIVPIFSNVHHSFSKLNKILTLMIKRAKGIDICDIHF